MAKCDICGKHVAAGGVTSLLDIYRQPGLEDVCGECGRWANNELTAIREEQCSELRRRICERAGRKPLVGISDRPWFWPVVIIALAAAGPITVFIHYLYRR